VCSSTRHRLIEKNLVSKTKKSSKTKRTRANERAQKQQLQKTSSLSKKEEKRGLVNRLSRFKAFMHSASEHTE